MSARLWLRVTWAPNLPEDAVPVLMKTSWLPRLLGKDGTTIGRTIRVRSGTTLIEISQDPAPGRNGPFVRHELTHVAQQRGRSVLLWLLHYILSPSFRNEMEAGARAMEQRDDQVHGYLVYPQFRVAGRP